MLDRKTVNQLVGCLSAAMAAMSILFAFQVDVFAGDNDMSVVAHASSGPLVCEIRKTSAGDAVQLTGIVSSSVALSGQARFVLTKSGQTGNSNISQGKAFTLAAGADDHVSHVTIDLGHDDHAAVELLVTSQDGLTCRATGNL